MNRRDLLKGAACATVAAAAVPLAVEAIEHDAVPAPQAGDLWLRTDTQPGEPSVLMYDGEQWVPRDRAYPHASDWYDIIDQPRGGGVLLRPI